MNVAAFLTSVRKVRASVLTIVSFGFILSHYLFPYPMYLQVCIWIMFVASMLLLGMLAPVGRLSAKVPPLLMYLGTLMACVFIVHLASNKDIWIPEYEYVTDLLLPLFWVCGVAHVMVLIMYDD